MTYTIAANPAFNSLEITFDGKPAQEVRDALKALKFRWHAVKKVWYGYATEEATRAAIDGGKVEKANASKPEKSTEQNHVKIYWNGIKIDGGKLIRCGYSLDNNADNAPSVSIYAKDYTRLPRDLFEVKNDSDLYTDYFENDRAYLTPDHPLYKYFRYAAEKAQARQDRPYCDKLRETLNSGRREPWPGHYNALRADLARREAFIARFDKTTDPGQPTAEDLEAINRQRQEEENARREAEHAAEIAEREKVLAERHAGFEYINTVAAKYPIKDGEPVVYIPFSENPAFYSFMVADTTKTTLHPDGTTTEEVLHKMPRCILSVTAAEIVLRHFDEIEASKGCGYDKTDFIIKWTGESGEPREYSGRYDLGDGDGGLIEHVRSWGEWCLTHDTFGHEKTQPEETNDIIKFADFLNKFLEA